MTTYEHLRVSWEADGRVAVLELDHGKANEMGSAQLREFETLEQDLRASGAMALITFSRKSTSRGTPVFVAGANVSERVGWTSDDVKAHVRWQRDVLRRLAGAPVFHVAVVHGVALGWGTEYLLCADYRIATDGAVFGLPETGLGIVPGAGGTSDLWAHIGVAQTLRLGMTGEQIRADEAQTIGLIQERVADVDDGLRRARALCDLVCRRSPTAVAAFKWGVKRCVGRAPAGRPPVEDEAYSLCVDAGEAAIGRAHFDEIRAGTTPPWGPRQGSR